MSRLLYELFVFLVTYLCFRHTNILHKEESHVANIRTFHISGTYTLFSYLLGGGGQMAQRPSSFGRFSSGSLAGDVIRRCSFVSSSVERWLHAAHSPRCSFMISIARVFRNCRLFIWVSMLLANITWALIPATFRRK